MRPDRILVSQALTLSDPPPDSTETTEPTELEHAEGLDRAVRRGARAVVVAQVLSQLIAFVTLGLLFRLVDRSEFGILGMVGPWILLARLLASFGLNVAAIQKPQLSRAELSGLFWLNLLFSLLATVGLAAFTPWIAWSYGEPRLIPVTIALATSLMVEAVGIQQQAALERNIDFRKLVYIRLVGQLIGGVGGIAFAWRYPTVWALVAQQYLELLIITALVWMFSDWKPHLPRSSSFPRDLIRFGSYYSLSGFMFFGARNIDKIALSICFGSSEAGLVAIGMYTQAYNLMMKPVYLITTPLTSLMLPALSRCLQRVSDYQQLTLRFFRMVAVTLFPCGMGLLLVAPEAMRLLGGDEWSDAARILSAFALTILGYGFINISGSVLASAGRTRVLFAMSAVLALIMTQTVLAVILIARKQQWDALQTSVAMAWSFTATTMLVYLLPSLWVVFLNIGLRLGDLFREVRNAALAVTLMSMMVVAVRGLVSTWELPLLPRALILVTTGAVTYCWMARREIQQFLRWYQGGTQA